MDFRDEETILEDIEGSIDFSDFLYPRQQAVVNDPALLRVVFGGRRSSKSVLIAAESLMVADQFQGMSIPYCSSSITNGLDILMPYIRQLDSEHNLKLHYNLGDHKVFTPGGGCVQFYGWGSKSEIEKGRGLKIPALYVDECGKIPQSLLKRGITETFGPATADFQGVGGRGILMSGNPDYVPGSYWNDMCGGNTGISKMGASVHHMTIFNNLFFDGRADAVVDEFCRQNRMKRSDSVVQREWFGRFCVDSDGLAYPHWKGIVHPMHLMPLGGYTTLGVDLGSDHPCAWVVIRWVLTESVDSLSNVARYIHHGHILETYEESGLQVPDVVAITREFQKAYNVGTTHGDSGGGGKLTIDTLAGTYGLDIQPVAKAGHKEDRIWMLDGMLANGTLHIHERSQTLTEQLSSVPKERKSNGRFDHMSGYPDHSLDACHYAILAAKQHLTELDLGPKIGSRDWAKDQTKRDQAIVNKSLRKATSRRSEMMQRLRERRSGR